MFILKKDSDKYCPKHKKSNHLNIFISVIASIALIAIFTVAINAKESGDVKKVTVASTEVVATTVPATTIPVTTVSATTAPVTTAPVTTAPVTTAPVTTEPATTAPVTTEPPTEIVGSGSQNGLIAIENPDPNYQGARFFLNDTDRETLRHIIMGEAGGEGYLGCCVLAQTIRDNWIRGGYTSAEAIRTGCQYDGWNSGSNADVEAAITFIFDEGGNAVQHRICFMYNPTICRSDWHETQSYVLTYGDVRYFDAW